MPIICDLIFHNPQHSVTAAEQDGSPLSLLLCCCNSKQSAASSKVSNSSV